ncbi:MAG: C40 family peptidase [Steroidobacteraceae bacterium]
MREAALRCRRSCGPSCLAALLLPTLLAACATTAPDTSVDRQGSDTAPIAATPKTLGALIATDALSLVGTPYRYGGADRTGMDCSGLVLYTHAQHGVVVPRTAREQRRRALPVAIADLKPGDLLFFRINGEATDHVGLYLGDGRFMHAPSSGRVVSIAYLDDPYFSHRLVAAGRFWNP